jgi:hypothetical protein
VTPLLDEQRNRYQGSPRRAWVMVRLATPAGDVREWKLVADTGNPFAFVIAAEALDEFSFGAATHVGTNFGVLKGAWFRLAMAEFGLDALVIGYGSAAVVGSAKASHADFDGLAGPPLLRLLEYGGDSDVFWICRRESLAQAAPP